MSEIRNLTRNGETFYPLTCSDAVLNRDGEPLGIVNDIFDVSEYNASGTPPVLATYASLDLAIAAIPAAKRKGGMSMRYVQTSDNKYVQYRLMSDTFNTTKDNWQGVDEEATVESDNLVLSKGIYNEFNKTKYLDRFESYGRINPINYLVLRADGTTTLMSGDHYDTSDYIDISGFRFIEFSGVFPGTTSYSGIVLYDENKNKVFSWYGDISGTIDLSDRPSAKFMRYCINRKNNNIYVILRDIYTIYQTFQKNILEIGRIYPRNYELLRSDGSTVIKNNDSYDTSDYINVSTAELLDFKVFPFVAGYAGLVLYDSSKNFIAAFGGTGSVMLKNYPNAVWMRYSASTSGNSFVKIRGVKIDNTATTVINVGANRTYTTIQDAINSITDASALNRYTVLVDEGTYDISNAGINRIPIKAYINIIGVSKKCKIVQRLASYSASYNAFENVAGFNGEAEIANFTIITEKSKGALHLDSNNWRGKIHFHDIECQVIENEEPYDPSLDYYKFMAASHGAINTATHGNQEIVIENVVTNGYIYSHTENNGTNNINVAPSKFVVKNCICDWIGLYSNGDKVRKTAIIERNRCNFIKIHFNDKFNLGYMTWDNIILNDNRCSFVMGEYKPYGGTDYNHNLWDEYYNKQMPCPDKSLYTDVQNITGSTINRGTKVKFTDYRHRYIQAATDSNDFDAITVHTIENNAYGVVQDGGDLNIFWDYILAHPYEMVV